MSNYIAIYLQNHEAAACGGVDLFRRVADQQRERRWGLELGKLSDEVADDLRRMRELMRVVKVMRNPLLEAAARLGVQVGRVKPNGHLLRRSPLSDLIEVEGLFDAVNAKAAGWRALLAADDENLEVHVRPLAQRAQTQLDRLEAVHHAVAAAVLS